MRALLIAATLLAPVSCRTDARAPADVGETFAQRDSAGIRIVENYRPRWADSEGWRVDREPLFVIRGSDGGPENRLLDPTSIDVDSRGRVIVGDGNQAGWDAVLVYDSLGRYEFQAGRAGEGPGEFGQLGWASSYRGDSIVGFDMSRDHLSIFKPNGEFARLIRTPVVSGETPPRGTYGFTAGADAAYGDGHFLAYPFGTLNIGAGPGPAWFEHLLLRLSPDGATSDTLGTFEIRQEYWSGTTQEEVMLAPRAVTAVGEDELFFGKGESFEIRRYDARGRLTALIRRAYDPQPVTAELRSVVKAWYLDRVSMSPGVSEDLLEQLGRDFDSARFAETLPTYSEILLDASGHLWVEEFRWFRSSDRSPIVEVARWSVFDPDGIWLGNVEMPPGFILREVMPDRVLGFGIDEFDVKEVYAYRLVRSGH